MAAPLTITATLNTPVVPYTGQERLVYALIEIGGGEPTGELPLDLALVIDCSESMRIKLVTEEQFTALAGSSMACEVLNDQVPAWRIESVPAEIAERLPTRLGFVQQALWLTAGLLRDDDRFTLSAFAGEAQDLLPLLPGSQRDQLTAATHALGSTHPGDGTQISAGLALGCRMLGELPMPGRARRVLLLTDGFAEDVAECHAWAARARTAGLAISTVGLGSDFNEDLLIPLADTTGGNAYYIEDPAQLPVAFQGELASARQNQYQNIELKLRLPRGARLRQCSRVQPTFGLVDTGPADETGSYTLWPGSTNGQEPLQLLLECILPAWMPGSYRLAQLVLAWDDPNPAQGRPKQRLELLTQVSKDAPSTPNSRIMNIVERVSAYRLGTQALAAARSGSGQATSQLRQAATRLLAVGEDRLANTMLAQADILQQAKPLDPNATKRLSYATRRLSTSGEG